MWSACVGVCQLLNWKMHGETLKYIEIQIIFTTSVLKMKVLWSCCTADSLRVLLHPLCTSFEFFVISFFLPLIYFIFPLLVSASYYSSFSSSSTTFLSFPFFTLFLCSQPVLSWASGCHFSSSLNDLVFIIKICEREKFCLKLLTSERIQTIQPSFWKLYTKFCNT